MENQHKGYKGKWTAEEKYWLQEHLKSDDIETLDDARQCLEQDLDASYSSISGMSYVFR